MSNSKKLMLTALAVILLLGATPLFAQPVGTWEGTGEGWCPFPVPYPSEYMKPWQTWKGRLEPDPDQVGYIFFGGLGFAIPIDYVKHFINNRESFAYDKDNPNTGYKYLQPAQRRNKASPKFLKKKEKQK